MKAEGRALALATKPPSRNSSSAALATLATVAVATFVLATLYIGREVLIPLAMAALVAFLLTPAVVRLERFLGRVMAVVVAVMILMGAVVGVGWMLTGQMINLMEKLPDYQGNMKKKLHALKVPESSNFTRLSSMVAELKQELTSGEEVARASTPTGAAGPSSSTASVAGMAGNVPLMRGAPTAPPTDATPHAKAVPVEIVEDKSSVSVQAASALVLPIMGPLGTAALVLLLTVCMLLQRENVRSRLTRIVGGGKISATKRAMDDAADRVATYLQMQFLVNITYGLVVAVGLYFIGVPNVLVWGVLSAVLRFVPYVGAWIAAACPIILSLAVSDGWTMPLATVGMFVGIELLFANLVEPWLYGAHTGVSTLALILAAVFWTWLWGAAGLVLATPLTVCLLVMARHVPALHMLGILLSDEEPLLPHQEFYHRLLSPGEKDVGVFAESYIKTNSQMAFFDSVFIPALIAIERDQQNGELDPPQHADLQEDLNDVVEDMSLWTAIEGEKTETDGTADGETGAAPPETATCRVLCVPARANRDGIASSLMARVLRSRGFEADVLSAKLTTGELIEAVIQDDAEVLCISVIPPTTIIQTRYLCGKLHAGCPKLRIMIGLWGATEGLAEAAARLRASGADSVVTTFAEATAQLSKYAVTLAHEAALQQTSPDETARLAELNELHLIDTATEAVFDRITARLARILNVPIALISLINADRQFFKAEFGLPEPLAKTRSTPREMAVCSQVVSSNKVLVVEDLARDRRFAANPLVREMKLRFYAGVPLRTRTGHAIGSLCVMDYKSRRFSFHEIRLLEVTAEEVMEIINARTQEETAAALVTTEPLHA